MEQKFIQLNDIDLIVGKTIKAVSEYDSRTAILFTDDTFIQIEAYTYSDDSSAYTRLEEDILPTDLKDYWGSKWSPHWDLLYSEETLKTIFDEGCRKQEEETAQRNLAIARNQYEELKKRFENNP